MSSQLYQYIGWYIICTPKTVGTELNGSVCSKDSSHEIHSHPKPQFCSTCGSKMIDKEVPHQTSFIDVYEREEYLGDDLCSQLEDAFFHMSIDGGIFGDEYCEVVVPCIDDLFHIDEDGDIDRSNDFTQEINPNELKTNFAQQRKLIKSKTKLLKHLYKDVEIKFGKIGYWA